MDRFVRFREKIYALLYLQDNATTKADYLRQCHVRTRLKASLNFGELALADPTISEAAKTKYILIATRSNRLLLYRQ
jgi:hypothetical protein